MASLNALNFHELVNDYDANSYFSRKKAQLQ